MTEMTTMTDPGKGTTTTEAAVEALAATRGQGRNGVDVVMHRHFRRRRCSTEGVPGTPTSTRTGGENPRISLSSVGSSFGLVKRFNTRCGPSNRSQGAWPTMRRRHLLTHQQAWCSKATKPPRSSMLSSRDSRPPKKKHSHRHEVSCP
jgi:hypothetical protein